MSFYIGHSTGLVKHLDVFILSGQSNAIGYADVSDLSSALQNADRTNAIIQDRYHNSNDANTTLNNTGWIPMVIGNTALANGYTGRFGPEIGFIDRVFDLTSSYTRKVAILKYAVGGNSLAIDFDPTGAGNYAYQKLATTITNGLAELLTAGYIYTVKGVIWMQGETDAKSATDSSNYQTNLTAFISAIRTLIGNNNLPFVIGNIIRTDEAANAITVRAAQAAVTSADAYASLVDTTSMSHSDNVHLDAAGQIAFGTECANEMKTLIALP
jgi:hypothetical protein